MTEVHEHVWVRAEEDTQTTRRYACACGAAGWEPKFLSRAAAARGERRGIREYARPPAPVSPEVTRRPRGAGRNETGGYLTPSGGRR